MTPCYSYVPYMSWGLVILTSLIRVGDSLHLYYTTVSQNLSSIFLEKTSI